MFIDNNNINKIFLRLILPYMKKMIVFLLLCLSLQTQADDAPVQRSYSGTVKPIANSEIELSKELVVISPSADTYIVDAKFELFNYGDSTTISVGFPETKDDFVKDSFLEFTTYVNNEKVEVKPTGWKDISESPGSTTLQRWWVKKVNFPANKYITIRVTYKTKYSIYTTYDFINYDFSTGRFWKNKIKEISIIIKFDDYKFPFFLFNGYGMPLSSYDTLISPSTEGNVMKTDEHTYIPIEFERNFNEIKWRLLNYEPKEWDKFKIVLLSPQFTGGFVNYYIEKFYNNFWELSNPFIYCFSLKQNEIKFDKKKFNKIKTNIEKGIKFKFWLRNRR